MNMVVAALAWEFHCPEMAGTLYNVSGPDAVADGEGCRAFSKILAMPEHRGAKVKLSSTVFDADGTQQGG